MSGVNLNATKGFAKLIKSLGNAKGRQMERRIKPSAKDSGVGTIKEALDVLCLKVTTTVYLFRLINYSGY